MVWNGNGSGENSTISKSSMTLEEFTGWFRDRCHHVAVEIQTRNLQLERSVTELVDLVWLPCRDPARFFQTTTESIVAQGDNSVERLKPPPQQYPGRKVRTGSGNENGNGLFSKVSVEACSSRDQSFSRFCVSMVTIL